MSSMTLIPETAPFSDEQRAWLNGFLSGLIGLQDRLAPQQVEQWTRQLAPAASEKTATGTLDAAEDAQEDYDAAAWHDASLPIVQRMELADGKPPAAKLMAAMAQLDCGSCGYLCKSYSAALANGEEKNLTLCTPGGKETKQAIKRILQETSADEPVSSLNGKATEKLAERSSEKILDSESRATMGYSRKNPYMARLLQSLPLNKAGSSKDTRHVVIDLGDSGLEYQVGDALGVYPTNPRALVGAIIQALACEPRTQIRSQDGPARPLETALSELYCLRDPSDTLLELLVERIADTAVQRQLRNYVEDGVPNGFDVLDALQLARGATITATEFVEMLAPLTPRLYSIASSMRQVGREVHLTVGKVSYEQTGRCRQGVASTMLSERLSAGDALRVFVHPNHGGFTVPSDPRIPIIMVGPGTGIAPFRAFLQERAAQPESGKNWLFFGDQHADSDFLYQDELLCYVADQRLQRLDTAFSRDGEQKIYVQDRMRQQGAELWRWLEQGAHFYVCGDASRMARDVDSALKAIIAQHSGRNTSQAEQYVKQLQQQRRYVRDVY